MDKINEGKISIVVCDGHTLGLIHPESKNVEILKASILKGANFEVLPEPKMISTFQKVRLASKKDFDSFHVHFGSFSDRNEYNYQ